MTVLIAKGQTCQVFGVQLVMLFMLATIYQFPESDLKKAGGPLYFLTTAQLISREVMD